MVSVVDCLEQAWQGWATAGADAEPEQWARPTRLPGWTVKDLYAHHAGFPSAVLAAAGLDAAVVPVTHSTAVELLASFNRPDGIAHTAAGQVRDLAVSTAEERSTVELTAQFSSVAPEAIAAVRAVDPARPMDYPGGPVVPFGEALRVALMEAVVHYLDLARALDLPVPGPIDGAPLRATAALLAAMADPVTLVERAAGRTGNEVFPVLR